MLRSLICAETDGQQHKAIIAEVRLTSIRGCAIVDAMNRARLPRLPLDGRLMAPGFVLGRQALVPVDKPAGGGAFVSM